MLIPVRIDFELDYFHEKLLQMVEQMMDTKFSEKGLGSADTELSTGNKQVPVDVKKTPLRDLQNDNRITKPSPIRNSPFSKDSGPVNTDAIKLSGVKRPSAEGPRSPSHHQSPNSTAANGHLVYVRRKPESELCKSSTFNGTEVTTDCAQLKQHDQQDETAQSNSQLKEQKGSCFSSISSPFPVPSFVGTSEKPSVPLSLGMSGMSSGPSESNHPSPSTIPLVGNSKRINNVKWEERFQQLQILLRKLDQSDHEDYLQMLRSLSSVELSRHAVELEKRSIQLSLEEAKEMQRVAALNVMGKST